VETRDSQRTSGPSEDVQRISRSVANPYPHHLLSGDTVISRPTRRGGLGKISTLIQESTRASSKGSGLGSRLLLAIGPTAQRALRRLPVPLRAQRLLTVRIGSIDVSYRLNAGDIQSIREVLVDEAYRLPFDIHPRSIVDLGANIGLTSLYYGARFSPPCIVAVEPDAENAAIARRNLAPFGAQVVEAAVSPFSGTVAFQASAESNLGRVDPMGKQRVRSITMDEVLDLVPDGRADLVKIDIEGGEEALFSENCSWLDRVDAIIIELHPPTVDVHPIVERIESAGFQYVPAGSVWTDSMDAFLRRDGLANNNSSGAGVGS